LGEIGFERDRSRALAGGRRAMDIAPAAGGPKRCCALSYLHAHVDMQTQIHTYVHATHAHTHRRDPAPRVKIGLEPRPVGGPHSISSSISDASYSTGRSKAGHDSGGMREADLHSEVGAKIRTDGAVRTRRISRQGSITDNTTGLTGSRNLNGRRGVAATNPSRVAVSGMPITHNFLPRRVPSAGRIARMTPPVLIQPSSLRKGPTKGPVARRTSSSNANASSSPSRRIFSDPLLPSQPIGRSPVRPPSPSFSLLRRGGGPHVLPASRRLPF
jgi:hypothetical protein